MNQILREIARQSGMKITGGVADERVYGKFGPGPPADVLASLLEGTGINMLLQETAADAPAELILTPRNGGPSPPSPNAAGFDNETQTLPQPQNPVIPVSQPYQPARLPFSRPVPTPPLTSTDATPVTPPPGEIVGAPTVAPSTEPGTTPGPTTQTTGTSDTTSGTTDTTSPNGIRTPQQIYLELQRLQQQQQQTPH